MAKDISIDNDDNANKWSNLLPKFSICATRIRSLFTLDQIKRTLSLPSLNYKTTTRSNAMSVDNDVYDDADKWSNLLPKLLHLIASQFDDHKDLLTFRSVCKSWRSVAMADARLTPFPPLFLIPYDKSNDARTFFDPLSRKELTVHIPESVGKFIYAVGHGYLLLVSKEEDAFVSTLFNPITRSQIHLPALRPHRRHFFVQHYSDRNFCLEDFQVFLSSHPCSEPAPILAVWANFTLFFLTIGDDSWREVELGKRYFSEDSAFAYYHGSFFLIEKWSWSLVSLVIDAQSLESSKLDIPIVEGMVGMLSYRMIVFSGNLFLVVNSTDFSVTYKLVKENGGRWRWLKEDYNDNNNGCISSDFVFFLSNHLSVAVASPDVIGCKPNYIYNGMAVDSVSSKQPGYVTMPMVWTEKFDLPLINITEEHDKIDRNLWFHKFYDEVEPPDNNGYTWFIPDPH